MHGRRRFLCCSAAALALGFRPPGRRAGRAPRRTADTYVDIHTHLSPSWGPRPGLSAKDLLEWMDAHDVEKAVVLPLVSPESWFFPVPTDYVLKQTKPHRDRLIPFCDIDPRTPNLGGKKGMAALLRKYVDAGAKGVGEHKTGVAIDDPRNMTVFEAAAEVGLPVLFHLDNARNMDTPGLPGLEKVLKAFPGIPFIGHAQGWWASIDGAVTQEEMQGYPKRKVAPGGAMDRLMDAHPNLYGDLSAGSGANAFRRDPEFARKFIARRADRLLFGTDYLAPGQGIPQFELHASWDLPAGTREKIYRGNALRLLGA